MNLVDLLTRSARVPRSGLASIAITRSSLTWAKAIPRRVLIVVFPTPPLRVRTGMYLVPPARTAPIRASIALRALTLGESPKLTSFRLTKKTKRRHPDSGAARNLADASSNLSAVSIAAGSGSSKTSPRRLSLLE